VSKHAHDDDAAKPALRGFFKQQEGVPERIRGDSNLSAALESLGRPFRLRRPDSELPRLDPVRPSGLRTFGPTAAQHLSFWNREWYGTLGLLRTHLHWQSEQPDEHQAMQQVNSEVTGEK
jgi:hypothetical protein